MLSEKNIPGCLPPYKGKSNIDRIPAINCLPFFTDLSIKINIILPK